MMLQTDTVDLLDRPTDLRVQAAFPELEKSRGVVINMSSMMAVSRGPGILGYRLGKAAQVMHV